MQTIGLAMGCFWGAERLFWQMNGVFVTRVGYQGGQQENPTYAQVCNKTTGLTETVEVVYDPALICLEQLLAAFWENHDPTQGDAQGNDIGPQYRSAVFTQTPDQTAIAKRSLDEVQQLLDEKGLGQITTQLVQGAKFWMAEDEHQQYLAKHPGGYCSIGGTGITCGVSAP